MFYNLTEMLGLKCFICSHILWLFFVSAPQVDGVALNFESRSELSTLYNDTNHQALIVANHLDTPRANWSFKTIKIPCTFLNYQKQLPIADAYDYKLLYIKIVETISLKLTSRTLIFPFHFFT